MVKQLIHSTVDDQVLQKFVTCKQCVSGVLVGHSSGTDKDYIAAYIECPNKDDVDNDSSSSVADIDDTWFAAYASQIALNVPGGISIIGIFLCAKESDAKEVSNKLKTLATRTFRLLSNMFKEYWSFSVDQGSLAWTLIHFNQENAQTVSVRQYDVTCFKDAGRSVELKRLNHNIAWSNLQTAVNLSQCNVLSTRRLEVSSFHALCNRISQAQILFDQEYRPESQLLDPASSQSTKASKNKKSIKPESSKVFHCQVYLPFSESNMSTCLCEKSNKAKVQGSVLVRAFVPPGSTVKAATDALKSDIIRSIHQRCLLLHERSCETEDVITTSVQQLPIRVLAKDNTNAASICFSEYLMQDEPIAECVDKFRDLIGISVVESDMTHEYFRDIGRKKPVVENIQALEGTNDQEQTPYSTDSRNIVVLVAVLAIVVGIFLLLVRS